MSASAERPVWPMVSSAVTASAGLAAAAYRAPSAWEMTTCREWATMSCISRAMWLRSSAAASSRSCRDCTSRRWARSSRARTARRRLRTTSPNAHAVSTVSPQPIAMMTMASGSAGERTVRPSGVTNCAGNSHTFTPLATPPTSPRRSPATETLRGAFAARL